MKPSLTPVSGMHRVGEMDALRGFAILGIFIANLGSGFSFYDPAGPNQGPWFTSFDHTMSFLHHMFIEGKFYSIFSFLFGWGIAIQLERSGDKGLKPAGFVSRRLLFMFLLGLAHIILLWPGDIVAFYALVGFILLLMRQLQPKTLFLTAIILILSPILLYALKMKWPNIAMAPSGILWLTGQKIGTQLTGITSNQEFIEYNKHMDYPGLVKINLAGFFFRFADLFFQSRISKVLGMFIIGYLVARNERFKNIISNKKTLIRIAIIALIIGLPSNYLLAWYMEHDNGAYYDLKIRGLYRTIVYALGVAPLACAYIALFFLVYKTISGKKFLSLLKPVGKMAFSNYIFQSLVGSFTFLGLGFGMMGKVGPVWLTLFAFLVFIVQIILSRIWLHFFQFGPVEWLWRTATYGKKQPVLKRQDELLAGT